MWPFNRKSDQQPLLQVLIGDTEVCSIFSGELPAEKLPLVELRSRDEPLVFIDSRGEARSFDMSSAFNDGARFFRMSIRVSQSFAVQPDGILTAQESDDAQMAYKNGAKGIRFQPFLLPESSGRNADLMGRGLFVRGLHFSGTVTPGNVSVMCLCDNCRRSFRLQSFHAGFSDAVYFYCSGGCHTLVVDSGEEDAPPVLGKANAVAVTNFESRLPNCQECRGDFRYMNPLHCPHCKHPYIDFVQYPEEREREYYGNFLYGDSPQRYEPPKVGQPALIP